MCAKQRVLTVSIIAISKIQIMQNFSLKEDELNLHGCIENFCISVKKRFAGRNSRAKSNLEWLVISLGQLENGHIKLISVDLPDWHPGLADAKPQRHAN